MKRYDDVESYYLKKWGKTAREAAFERDNVAIKVLKWSASEATGGVTLYATLGASDHPPTSGEPSHRHEFFLGFSPECDDVAESMAGLGAYTYDTGRDLGPGHIYRVDDGGFYPTAGTTDSS
jgi:hypothetical protein